MLVAFLLRFASGSAASSLRGGCVFSVRFRWVRSALSARLPRDCRIFTFCLQSVSCASVLRRLRVRRVFAVYLLRVSLSVQLGGCLRFMEARRPLPRRGALRL